MPDKYEIETQYYPALLSSMPFLLLGYYFLSGIDGDFWSHAATATVGGVGITGALYWLQISLCRAIGKAVEDKMFESGKKMPTTELLLSSSHRISQNQKELIAAKIKKDFGIELGSRLEDTHGNRLVINETVSQIRTKMGRKNPLISQRNRQYGFVRNMLGGALLATAASLAGIVLSVISNNSVAFDLSTIFAVVYLLVAGAMFMLLRFMGIQYAHALYDEYLASK